MELDAKGDSCNVTIEDLPGHTGVEIDRYLTNREMRDLSQHFEGIEFALRRGVDSAGNPYYLVTSGREGELGQIGVDFVGNQTRRLLSHTHPVGGDLFASPVDMVSLDNAINNVSRIIVLDSGSGQLVTFSPISPRISIRPLGR